MHMRTQKCCWLGILGAYLGLTGGIFAEIPSAIFGGRDQRAGPDTPFATLISTLGIPADISENVPIAPGRIRDVAMNSSGISMIGGLSAGLTVPYAALVSPSGVATHITGSIPSVGEILGVGINDSGLGILGGIKSGTLPYAATVSVLGNAQEITGNVPLGNGKIFDVAINHSGIGIVAGRDQGSSFIPYLAFVSPSGVATRVSMPPSAELITVGINSASVGVVGGREGSLPYAAMVSPSGVVTHITGMVGDGLIFSVGISDTGTAIIGGVDQSETHPYVVLVSPNGVATNVTGALPTGTPGEIRSVAINKSGASVIGGQGASLMYAALVSPSGVAVPISGDFPIVPGVIESVAIDDSGVAIIGGRLELFNFGYPLYTAVVSPSGVATRIQSDRGGNTATVRVAIRSFVPTFFGTDNSVSDGTFVLSSQVLSTHLVSTKSVLNGTSRQNDPVIGLVADISPSLQQRDERSMHCATHPDLQRCSDTRKYALWLAPFGNYAHQGKVRGFPASDHWVSGLMAAFDYHGIENTVVGMGTAYAFNTVHFHQNMGHSNANQEFLTFYGAWCRRHVYVNCALWGGTYQMKNIRSTIASITSTSHIHGWILDPHVEVSIPFRAKKDWLLMDPFVMCDWANNWQGHVHEKGASGLNLQIGHQYTSRLRSEIGMRIYETIRWERGTCVLQEKASWVNTQSFHTRAAQAIFVAGISPFSVEMFSAQTQNLGAVQFNATFFPCSMKTFCTLNYQGEFGHSMQSHTFSFEIGTQF